MVLDAQYLEVLMSKEKILVIQTAFIGDAILTLPLIQKIKEAFPNSEIDVISIPSTEIIFRSSPSVSKVIVLDKKSKHKSLFNLFRFSRLIKNEKYNKIFSPHRSFRTSVIVKLSGVSETYGFENSSLKFVYKNVVPYLKDEHEVRRNLNLLKDFINPEDWKIQPILFPGDYIGTVNNFLNSVEGKKLIAIAPGSVWATKKYPAEYFGEVVKFLATQSYHILLIGGKEDHDLCESIGKGFESHITNLAGVFNLVESVQILAKCQLLISNDSAPTHLGMSANIPVLTIFCSTIPKFGFYPYNSRSRAIGFDDLDCKPCGIHGHTKCPEKTFACGYKLTPLHVIKEISDLLSQI